MFQLLSSFWLFALASLLVPVLIHLWHKKKPQVIRVGSIRWLQAATSKRLSRLQFQDKWLLILRCLILGLLVIFLCQPVWQTAMLVQPVRQVFVAPELIAPGQLKNIQNTLDSYRQQGYQLRTFTAGFNQISPEKWQLIKQGEEKIIIPAHPENYWSLAELISSRFKTTAETIIITSDHLANFKGSRPVLPATYKWLTLPVTNQHFWLQEAVKTGPDSVSVRWGNSSATGIQFKQVITALPVAGAAINIPGLPGLRYQSTGEKEYLFFEDQVKRTVIQHSPFRVNIFYDSNREADARYVQAALKAISDYTRKQININLITNIPAINPESNWIFWLSDAAIPKEFQKQINAGVSVLKDAPGQAKTTSNHWFRSSYTPEQITVYRQQRADNKITSSSAWRNNFGEEMLHREPLGQGSIYYFRSRFNTSWNDLPNNPHFPELISSLLFPEPPVLPLNDKRAISPEQAAPIMDSVSTRTAAVQLKQWPLQEWFLAFAALLFLTERIWTYRNATT